MFNDEVKNALLAGKIVRINIYCKEVDINMESSLSTIEHDLGFEINIQELMSAKYKIFN